MYDARIYSLKEFMKMDEAYRKMCDPITSQFNEAIIGRKKKIAESKNGVVTLSPNPLVNMDNYGPYQAIASEVPNMPIDVQTITKESWGIHYISILNILKDGIYADYVQHYQLKVIFSQDNMSCFLSIPDYFINLIMWRNIIFMGDIIHPKHLFFEVDLRAKAIKEYIDRFIIDEYVGKVSNVYISNVIADSLYYFHNVDDFSDYLCNTLNLEDTAQLMVEDPEFYRVLHNSYKSLQVDQVNDAIMKDAHTSIDRIRAAKALLGHDHCLVDIWRTNEGINPKQYAEFTVALGIKPDGRGGIFPHIIDASFIGGGMTDPVDYFIESSTSRVAQIEKHKNVSKSGVLARIMNINNSDTALYPDERYDCHTDNLIPVEVKSSDHLKSLNLRYYRLTPNGQEKCINHRKDQHLIGKTILLRSPITCASHARGHGICMKCYGRLAFAIHDYMDGSGVNVGVIASELITSKQTQKQLSAKHILKASIDKIEWSIDFYSIFEMENTVVRLSSDIENPKEYILLIDQDAIESDSEFEGGGDSDDEESFASSDIDEYVTEFDVLHKPTGQVYHITTESGEKLFITNELNAIIRNRAVPTDDKIAIPVSALKENPLFAIKVRNNEINKVLLRLKNLFNRSNEVKGKQIHELLQEIIDTNIEGDMGVSAIHYETILSNQIRDPDDVLEVPDWSKKNPPYRILTLDEALTKNPSVTISLSYQKITRALYDPLTYRKKKASFIDQYFMEYPQSITRDIDTEDIRNKRAPGVPYEPFKILEDVTKITVEENTCDDDGTILDIED